MLKKFAFAVAFLAAAAIISGAAVDFPILEPQFVAAEPTMFFTNLVGGRIVGQGGILPVRASLNFRDWSSANTIHWRLEVVTTGANPSVVWWHRYPDFVVPINTAAPAVFAQDLMMPAGLYTVQLRLADDVIDGATGQAREQPWLTDNIQAAVNP